MIDLSKSYMLLLCVFVIVVIFLSLPSGCKLFKKEGFFVVGRPYKHYCSNCGYKSKYKCANCVNCGYCITPNGYGECVPGDSNGPYFRNDCVYYSFGRNYYPYSNIYPIVKAHSLYPYNRWSYRRMTPYKWWKRRNASIWKSYKPTPKLRRY